MLVARGFEVEEDDALVLRGFELDVDNTLVPEELEVEDEKTLVPDGLELDDEEMLVPASRLLEDVEEPEAPDGNKTDAWHANASVKTNSLEKFEAIDDPIQKKGLDERASTRQATPCRRRADRPNIWSSSFRFSLRDPYVRSQSEEVAITSQSG